MCQHNALPAQQCCFIQVNQEAYSSRFLQALFPFSRFLLKNSDSLSSAAEPLSQINPVFELIYLPISWFDLFDTCQTTWWKYKLDLCPEFICEVQWLYNTYLIWKSHSYGNLNSLICHCCVCWWGVSVPIMKVRQVTQAYLCLV